MIVSNAFGAADTIVSNAFGAADTVVSNAFGAADTVISNAFVAADLVVSNAYTNTAVLAAAALPKAGGTMTGGLTNIYGYGMGTNLIAMFGGVLTGTNGVYWSVGTNNYWLLFP